MGNNQADIICDLDLIDKIIARKGFEDFARYVMPDLQFTDFHKAYYRILHYFAIGKIKRLIVSIPPQHGKSLGSTQLLPAYILGLDPNLKIAIASYNATMASRFNRRIQRIISDDNYLSLFPSTCLKNTYIKRTRRQRKSDNEVFVQTSTEFDIADKDGGLISVGREGALTGNKVDVFILDDLYKDAMEANSPVIRANCWEWYIDVVKTRQHNNTREIIVFTRWHEEDLIGTLCAREPFVELKEWSQIDTLDPDEWLVVNFEALKESEATEVDPRQEGEALWLDRHNNNSLMGKRNLDIVRFNCMYQGHPSSKEGLLYGDNFQTYDTLIPDPIKYANYTDTADTGGDKLCSICYEVSRSGRVYITDVLYTAESMESTEPATANMLARNDTRISYIESNNGGRGFARAIQRIVPTIQFVWFHQSGNKEARILSNSATVLQNILMPSDWKLRWPEFYKDLVTYKRVFKANRHDDAPDVLTGIVEKEIQSKSGRTIRVLNPMRR